MHIIIKLIIAIVCTAATFTCVESASTVVELNEDNWESLTRGKTLWVKFCTKDCAHCKKMHIAWERLADAWVEVEGVVIGRVKCDDEVPLCNRFDVTGTPTLLYGDRNNLSEYGGDKDFLSLNAWAKEVLIPICSPDNTDPCSDVEKQWIDDWMKMNPDEIQQMIDSKLQEEEDIHKVFDVGMAEMQAQYDAMNNKIVLEKARAKKYINLLVDVRAKLK